MQHTITLHVTIYKNRAIKYYLEREPPLLVREPPLE